jgi:hypothetical protein
MPEGLSGPEVGREISEHAKHAAEHAVGSLENRKADWISISEAILLSVVAIIAAYSGYSAAQWNTHSSVSLAAADAARTKANRADLESLAQRNFDSSTFNTWFTAYIAKDARGMALAKKRFSPAFRIAFNAWWATDPTTNPKSPPGPTYMPQYQQPQLAAARALDTVAQAHFAAGAAAGANSDKYIRVTVYLATVLFMIGISAHFPLLAARYGLVTIGSLLVIFSVIQLLQLPRPPG